MQVGTLIKNKAGRLVVVGATSVFAVGVGFLSSGTAHAIGGLCNGQPASHTWLDASGQYGPALLDGTNGDDTIVGSDGGIFDFSTKPFLGSLGANPPSLPITSVAALNR